MDKKIVKCFSIGARKILISGVMTKLAKLGITNSRIEEPIKIDDNLIEISTTGERYRGKDIKGRTKLVEELSKREQQTGNRQIAYDTLVEEVAYTWFNRLIAIRFMEVNDYLPERERVLSSESGIKQPDIITHLLDTEMYAEFDLVTKEHVTELLSDSSADAVDELYQLVFIKQCNSLNQQLPDLFEKIDDYTELLFTISYIDENGVIASLLNIPEDAFNVDEGGQVEIIGWMYQYYNTEPKDKVFARGSRKIRADEIPAATQLFTPDWIVRYMVENSLGRYYIDQKMANPNETQTEKEIADEFNWQYYLPTAEQPEDVQLQIQDERQAKSDFALQELKLIDPSMGSGHILVYAFDVFMQLYEAEGQSPRTAAELILENNLFGLDIDQRAFQLAYFALMMKGRQYSRRILAKQLRPNVYVIPNNSEIGEAELQLVQIQFNDQKKAQQDLLTLVEGFKNGAELGSLIQFEGLDFKNLKSGLNNTNVSFFDQSIKEMILVGELLQQQYEIGITNPPYMGSSGFGPVLSKFAKKQYPNSKSDLFAMFMERWNKAISCTGYNTMVTMQSWMFLSSYETMRKNILVKNTINNIMHMENMVMGIAFGTVVATFQKSYIKGFKGTYHQIKTKDASIEVSPKTVPIFGNRFNRISQDKFKKIPGSPISYWVSENIFRIFSKQASIGQKLKAGTGLQSSDGIRFLRYWFEIDSTKINAKWFHLAKGGAYRKWSGNDEYVVNWEDEGKEIKESIIKRYPYLKGNYSLVVKNERNYFSQGVLTSRVTSGKLSFRISNNKEIFSDATTGLFPKENILFYLGLLNSPLINLISDLNPTLNFQAGDLEKMPIIIPDEVDKIEEKVLNVITIANEDWIQSETAPHFKDNPLI